MENREINFSFADYTLCLDLISKVKGVAETEKYFHDLPPSAKNKFTYGTLLHFYCNEAMEDKALSLFREMEGLGFACSTLSYNNIMVLHLKNNKLEKIRCLADEMKQRNISLNAVTYSVWMQSYARLDDIKGVERVYQEMLENDAPLCNWNVCGNLAACYVKAGLVDKAEPVLKKLELVMDRSNREAYHHLITLHTNLSNLADVHRVWASLKAAFRITTNNSYLVMLVSLCKLKDFEGIKKVYEEWESKCLRDLSYDTRLAKVVIRAYLEQDRLEEAETVFKHASVKAAKPFLSGMEQFMVYFLERGLVDRFVEFLEAAVPKSKNEAWIPHVSTIDAFLTHFQGSGDVETANQVFSLLKDVDSLKGTAYRLLLTTYVAAGKTDPGMRRMLEEDGIDVGGELEKLLLEVCPP